MPDASRRPDLFVLNGDGYGYRTATDAEVKASGYVLGDELLSARALNAAAAAFENRIGTTHGVGDGLRAALAAVVNELSETQIPKKRGSSRLPKSQSTVAKREQTP